MTLRNLTVAGLAVVALAGCADAAGGTPGAVPSPTRASNQAAAVALAQCQRANGFPQFPDPVQDDQGRWDFPTDTIGDWLPAEACRSLVHDWKIAFSDAKPLTAEDMTKLRAYAACMREHGLPDFPDPDERGDFALPDRIRVLADNHDPAFATADQACGQRRPPKPAEG
ncbi:hypothetical protein [Dactylosporangium sp. NPDC005555]|uniref:hypothetical protein n=1 Tax=Dactylosporangium sp. NPDC005555 TaxID=3154889 RepID=UPI0033B5A09A